MHSQTHLENITNHEDLYNFITKDWTCEVKKWGGRVFTNQTKTYSLNDFLKHINKLESSKTPYESAEQTQKLAQRIRELDKTPVQFKSVFLKISTIIRQFFGRIFFNREEKLSKMEKGEPVTAPDNNYRYLVFKRDTGRVACRVHGDSNKTIPRVTMDWDITFATRTILRDKNLVVLRNSQKNSRMIGPCDFYGPLEKAEKYIYTIEIENGFPRFYRRPKDSILSSSPPLETDFNQISVTIQAKWHRGNDEDIKNVKNKYITDAQRTTGESLFPTTAGILEIEGEEIHLPSFDASKYDLSLFKARLVKNNQPFSLADKPVASIDAFCPVSYYFESNYAKDQIENGGGLFLETHEFCQTMTPLDELAGGVVVLGRWKNEEKSELELIGVKIPFGYTLVVEKDCIHGDTTLEGMYMMAMTSNHTSMQTADVTFLKSTTSKKNFVINYERNGEEKNSSGAAPGPIVESDKDKDRDHFRFQINNGWPFYNPFSRILNPL